MKHLKKILFIFLILGLTGLTACKNRDSKERINHGAEKIYNKISDKLELDENSKQKLKVVIDEMKSRFNTMQSEKVAKINELQDWVNDKNSDATGINDIIQSRITLMHSGKDDVLNQQLTDFKNSLGDKQKEELNEMLEKAKKRRYRR